MVEVVIRWFFDDLLLNNNNKIKMCLWNSHPRNLATDPSPSRNNTSLFLQLINIKTEFMNNKVIFLKENVIFPKETSMLFIFQMFTIFYIFLNYLSYVKILTCCPNFATGPLPSFLGGYFTDTFLFLFYYYWIINHQKTIE